MKISTTAVSLLLIAAILIAGCKKTGTPLTVLN
jgi:predicted small secreted protein